MSAPDVPMNSADVARIAGVSDSVVRQWRFRGFVPRESGRTTFTVEEAEIVCNMARLVAAGMRVGAASAAANAAMNPFGAL